MEKDAADQALANGRISQPNAWILEIEFENRRYQIAYDALQERIALAQQDHVYSQNAIDKLAAGGMHLDKVMNASRAKQRQAGAATPKDAPSFSEMLEDGGTFGRRHKTR